MNTIRFKDEKLAFNVVNPAGDTEVWAAVNFEKPQSVQIAWDAARKAAMTEAANRANVERMLTSKQPQIGGENIAERLNAKDEKDPYDKLLGADWSEWQHLIYTGTQDSKLMDEGGRARVFYDTISKQWRAFINVVAVQTIDDFNTLRDTVLAEIKRRETSAAWVSGQKRQGFAV